MSSRFGLLALPVDAFSDLLNQRKVSQTGELQQF
jgi:hypothetical protein